MFGKPDSGVKKVRRGLDSEVFLNLSNVEVFEIVYLPNDNRPFAEVKIFDKPLVGLLDSGASVSILGKGCYDLAKQLELSLFEIKSSISTADGSVHTIKHCAYIPFTFNDHTGVVLTVLSEAVEHGLILGIDFWKLFGITPQTAGLVGSINIEEPAKCESQTKIFSCSPEQQKELVLAVKEFLPYVEGSLSRTNIIEHFIDTGNNEPIKQKYYPASPYVQKEIDKEITRMMNLGVIQPSSSPWSNPLVTVKKPDGSVRLCLDSRRLNSVTKKDAYPLPHISGILGRFEGTRYISKIDLKDAFWQIPLERGSCEKTAFTVPGRGLFEFVVMPFGLHNAPQTQCRLMDKVLGVDLQPFAFVYLDDIIVTTETFEQHIQVLREIAKRLKSAQLSINVSKSQFCAPSVKYLGFVIDCEGIRTDPDKIKAIVDFPPPTNVKEVRRLIGLVNWYRRFINNFSTIIAPITELLKKPKKKFVWTNVANDAFLSLKSALCSAPLLSCPNYNLPFYVQCDASDVGIGAVLWQKHDEGEKVIAYMSQKLTAGERKYSSTERECLAVLVAIEKFRLYIDGVRFTVITDHESLKWLMNLKDPTGRLGRWALKLQGFDYDIVHRKGKHNVVPDALSRAINCVLAVTVEDKHKVWYEELYKLVQEDPTESRDYQIRDGKLYRYQKLNQGLLSNWKLVIPPESKLEILKQNHDEVAHLGITKTVNRISENYFWKNMRDDIKDYVRSCVVCKASKPVTINTQAPMGNQKIANYPFQTISMDFIGVLPRSKLGNTVLFVVSDWYSKFVFLYPMRSADTTRMCTFLEEVIFLRFGVPQTIISDNGSQFISHIFRKLLEKYGIDHFKNAVYHPQNNPAERVNKVVVSAIRGSLGENASHRDWDREIAKIEYAINTSTHESTKLSPYFVIFGRNHIRNGNEYGNVSDPDTHSTELENRMERFDKIKEIVDRELTAAYNRQTHYYNTRSKNLISFKPDDIVWKKNFTQSKASENFCSKLAPLYVQCRVIRKVGNNTYDLEDMHGKFLGNYSVQDLRPV